MSQKKTKRQKIRKTDKQTKMKIDKQMEKRKREKKQIITVEPRLKNETLKIIDGFELRVSPVCTLSCSCPPSFLVADTRLYTQLCPSVDPSIRPLICLSVHHTLTFLYQSYFLKSF